MAWRDPWETVDRANAFRAQTDAQGVNMLTALQGMQTNALQRQQLQGQLSDQERARTKAIALENALSGVGPGADPMAVIAAVSKVDPMKGIEMQRALEKQKREAFVQIDPKNFTSESVAKFTVSQNYADLVPVRKMEMGPAGQVYDPYKVNPGTVFNDPNKAFSIGNNGAAVPNQQFQEYELNKAAKGAPKTDVRVTMDQGSAAFVDSLKESRKNAMGFTQSIQNAQDIRRLVDEGKIMTGPGTGAVVALANYLPIPGKDNQEKVGNTVLMLQKFGNEVLANAHYLKPMSNTDIQVVKEIVGANPNLSANTIRRGMQLYEEAMRAKVKQHNADADQFFKKTNGQGFSFAVPEPSPYVFNPIGVSQAGAPGGPSVREQADAILRGK